MSDSNSSNRVLPAKQDVSDVDSSQKTKESARKENLLGSIAAIRNDIIKGLTDKKISADVGSSQKTKEDVRKEALPDNTLSSGELIKRALTVEKNSAQDKDSN